MRIASRRSTGLIAAVAIVLLFAPMFVREGPLLWMDAPMWATVGAELSEHVLPQVRWFWGIPIPQANAGVELGQAYSTNLVVLWALVQVVSPALAVKLACLLSGLVFGSGLHRIGSRVGPPWLAALAAVLGVVGATAPILSGMWYELLSLGIALWGWDALMRFSWSGRARAWVAATLLFAATAFTHPLGVYLMCAVWAALIAERVLAREFLRRGPLRRTDCALLTIPLVALMLATPQIVALFDVAGDMTRTMVSEFHAKVLWRRLFCLHLLTPPVQAVVMLVAGVGVLRSRTLDRRWSYTVGAVGVMAVAVILEVPRALPDAFPFRTGLVMFASRFSYVLQPVYLVLFVVGGAALIRWVRGLAGRRRTLAALAVAALVAASAAEVAHYAARRASRRQITLATVESEPELRRLWSWINANVDADSSRIYFEDTLFSYPLVPTHPPLIGTMRAQPGHVLALTGLETDVKQINGWAVFTTSFGDRYCGNGGTLFNGADAATTDAYLRRLNCRYLVVHSDAVKEQVAAMPFLRQVETIGVFDVLVHDAMTPAWAYAASAPNTPLGVETRAAGFELVVTADGARGERVFMSVAYHPGWRATMDGNDVPLVSDDGLLAFDLPRDGPRIVRLTFEVDRGTGLLGMAAGVLFLILGAGLLSSLGTGASGESGDEL